VCRINEQSFARDEFGTYDVKGLIRAAHLMAYFDLSKQNLV